MVLTKEDINKYGTDEEKKLLEGLSNRKSLEYDKVGDYELTLMEESLSDGSKGHTVFLFQSDGGEIEFPCKDFDGAVKVYSTLMKLIKEDVV